MKSENADNDNDVIDWNQGLHGWTYMIDRPPRLFIGILLMGKPSPRSPLWITIGTFCQPRDDAQLVKPNRPGY